MLLLPGEPAPDTPPDSPRRADAGDGGGAGGATSGASRWSALQASATSAEVAATAAGGGGGAAADGGGAAATPYLRILGAVRAFKSMGSSVVSSVSGESPAVAAAEEEEEEEGEEEGEAAAEAEAVALEGDSQVFSLEAALRPRPRAHPRLRSEPELGWRNPLGGPRAAARAASRPPLPLRLEAALHQLGRGAEPRRRRGRQPGACSALRRESLHSRLTVNRRPGVQRAGGARCSPVVAALVGGADAAAALPDGAHGARAPRRRRRLDPAQLPDEALAHAGALVDQAQVLAHVPRPRPVGADRVWQDALRAAGGVAAARALQLRLPHEAQRDGGPLVQRPQPVPGPAVGALRLS